MVDENERAVEAWKIIDRLNPPITFLSASILMPMKRIEAFVRVNRLEAVKDALEAAGVRGLSCEGVRGYGRQMGRTDLYRGSTYAVNLLPKMRIEVVVRDEDVEAAIDAIIESARTGEVGDGKIFVTEVLDAIRVRTGERGDSALT
jgi:nitrogen regulatory protein P-II 1